MGQWSEANSLTGEQIKALRTRVGLSQREFAARLGVTHTHISKIESCKERPSDTLQMLIKYEFGIVMRNYAPVEETKPMIQEHLLAMGELLLRGDLSPGTLVNMEYILSSWLLLLNETRDHEQFQIQLLESLGCAIEETANFLAKLHNKKDFNKTGGLSFIQRELLSSFSGTYNLLAERLK